MDRKNLAARAGHWSATHRKAAIFGWLGFVVLAVLIGQMARPEDDLRCRPVQRRVGPRRAGAVRRRAEAERRGRPRSEPRPHDRRPRVPDDDRADHEPALTGEGRQERQIAAHRRAAVSADRRSALVEFQITGDALEAAKRLDPSKDAIAAVKKPAPRSAGRAVRQRQHPKGAERDLHERPGKAEMISLPITLLILIIAFGVAGRGRRPAAPCDFVRGGRDGLGRRSRATSPRSTATSHR